MRVIILVFFLGISAIGAEARGCNTLSVSGRPRYWNINMVGVYKKTDRILYGRSVYEQKASRKPTYQIYYEDHMEQGNWKIIKNPRKEVTLAFAEDSSMEPQYIKGSWKIRKYKYNLEIYEERELLIECKDESYRPDEFESEDNTRESNHKAYWHIAIRIVISALVIAAMTSFVYVLYKKTRTIKKKNTATMPAMHATAPPAYTSDVQVSSLSEKVDLNIPAYNDKSYDPPNYDELSRA